MTVIQSVLGWNWALILGVAATSALCAAIIHCLFVFTRPLKIVPKSFKPTRASAPVAYVCGDDNAYRHLGVIIRYGYVFTTIAFLLVAAPALLGPEILAPLQNSLIKFVEGCPVVQHTQDIEKNCKTREWYANLGGTVMRAAPITGANGVAAIPKKSQVSVVQATEELNALATNSGAAKATLARYQAADGKTMALMVVAGGDSARILTVPVISGGLSAPLYMVLLALMGGAIGMARRMPEIQLRGAKDYPLHYYTKNKGEVRELKRPLSPGEVREHVLFQMAQVTSAPMIAISAYAIFRPDNVGVIALVGFASGFASEAILMQLRNAAEGLSKLTAKV